MEDKNQGWPWWWVFFALNVGLALIVGFVIGAVMPHAITGDDLRRSFITGPPVAGLCAVVAALIAFAAAAYTARVSQRNAALAANEARISAENAERWKRIEWSADKDRTARVEHDRLVASARIQVKVDRSLGRKTDPRIVELSGL